MYRVLGIDPGTAKAGAAVLEINSTKSTFVATRLYILKGDHLGTRLLDLEMNLSALIKAWEPIQIMAWEREYQGKNWWTMGKIARSIGICEKLCAQHCRLGMEVAPTSARKAVFKGDMNYDAMRQILSEDMADPGLADNLPEDTVSAMIQARAAHIVVEREVLPKGFEMVFENKRWL